MKDEAYNKLKIQVIQEMDAGLQKLKDEDISVRKKGLRLLSDRSRMALVSAKADIVNEWFLDDRNRRIFFEIILSEVNDIILSELIYTVHQVCYRHAGQYRRFNNLAENQNYIDETKKLVESFVNHYSKKVLATTAGALAYFNDMRAWDLYVPVLEKYRDHLTVFRFGSALSHYGKFSITDGQKKTLYDLVEKIFEKSQKKDVKGKAKSILDMLAI